jgi:GNAT superfamily N-acetyltransferase
MIADPATPRLRRLDAEDLAAVVELQQAACAGVPPGFVHAKREAELAGFLDGSLGAAYGIAEGATLAAMALLRLPGAARPGPGLREALASPDMVVARGLPERIAEEDWALRTAFLENAMVLPAARGRGHQGALLDARLAHAAAAGMRWIFAGIHFRNAISRSNLLRRGLAIGGIRFDRAEPVLGMLRALDPVALACEPADTITVKGDDPAQHRAALARGYIGVRDAAQGAVVYRKLAPARPSSARAPRFPEPRDAEVIGITARDGGNA